MASDRLEWAREVEALRGSFLSTQIASALDEKFDEADKDQDGRLSLQDLKLWLEERATHHSRRGKATFLFSRGPDRTARRWKDPNHSTEERMRQKNGTIWGPSGIGRSQKGKDLLDWRKRARPESIKQKNGESR
jgi:hypothetical protein